MSGISSIGQLLNMLGSASGGLSSSSPLGQAAGALPSGSGALFGADLVSLSSSGNLMQQMLNLELQGDSGEGENNLTGLAQLKQQGEMLATLLGVKMKNFESGLVSSLKTSGLDSSREMTFKDGPDGMQLLGNAAGNQPLQQFLKEKSDLQGQFREIAELAKMMKSIDRLKPELEAATAKVDSSPAAQYSRQSQPKAEESPSHARFVMRVIEGSAQFSFEGE